MEKNLNEIIINTLNDYLIQEGIMDMFRKPTIKIIRYNHLRDCLQGKDVKTNEDYELEFDCDSEEGTIRKIEGYNAKADKTKRVKIANMPTEGYQTCFSIEKLDGEWYMWAFDEDFKYYEYSINEYGQVHYQNADGEDVMLDTSKIYCLPNQNVLAQIVGGNYEEEEEDVIDFGGNNNEDDVIDDGGDEGEERIARGDEDDFEDDGDDFEDDGDDEGDGEDDEKNEILNPQENHPLYNAIYRLIRSRQLEDSLCARYVMNDLFNIGY